MGFRVGKTIWHLWFQRHILSSRSKQSLSVCHAAAEAHHFCALIELLPPPPPTGTSRRTYSALIATPHTGSGVDATGAKAAVVSRGDHCHLPQDISPLVCGQMAHPSPNTTQVCTPGSTKRHTHPAFMAAPPPPPHTHTHAHTQTMPGVGPCKDAVLSKQYLRYPPTRAVVWCRARCAHSGPEHDKQNRHINRSPSPCHCAGGVVGG